MTSRVNLNPKLRRIPPRAEDYIRYINDVVVRNLKLGNPGDDITLEMPGIVSLAYKIVNETSNFVIQDVGTDVVFIPRQ
jgi:hypothetical protein